MIATITALDKAVTKMKALSQNQEEKMNAHLRETDILINAQKMMKMKRDNLRLN